ncbi:MAG: cyclopropane-fatty-acyl-phospholipid synthase [Chromatiales bacterium]|jgi:cyclopropane-fatty-acyl-phospholipid synthase|nr:cyclopropane-fatty-acyl-phospholipid synthase [Chromatiales bacterium]MDX9766940.1 cyclopropane-fatty-acyl-phospholipid synthase family protein [Ectothiorhodospiraceae bacterium]
MLLELLERQIRRGTLVVQLPGGITHVFGEGEPRAEIRFREPSAMARIAHDPAFEFGNTYMEGAWDAGGADLRAVLDVTVRNFASLLNQRAMLPMRWLRVVLEQGNRVRRAYLNVAHHYDLDEWLFRRFLDSEMFYSCAYFEREGMTLEEAQLAKCRLIARKLLLEPGMRVLDIGSGWGALAFRLASDFDVQVDGLTLSREQLRVAEAEAARRGLAERVRFHYCDYREHAVPAAGPYDRIVSVGMFEHVGQPYFEAFFQQVDRLLADDGAALLHTIGRTQPPGGTNPWIRRYIFPGGYTPALSEIVAAIEPTALMTTDVEVWRLHYADTLAEWFRRFQAVRRDAAAHFDERFCRMWEFYLASTEAAFRHWDEVVFHVQMAKRHGVVPTTRDYLAR